MTPDQSGAGNDPGAIVVRRYALRPPTGWDEDCEAEMRRMTDLWNRLVEIERAHRQAFQDATAEDPDVARLQSAITVIDAQIARAIDALKAQRAPRLRFIGAAFLPSTANRNGRLAHADCRRENAASSPSAICAPSGKRNASVTSWPKGSRSPRRHSFRDARRS